MISQDVLIEERVSSLIDSQFPAFYREEGPLFVLFVRKYFEWMETEGQALYHSRRLPSYKDIDQTTDDFIVYFKEKYLSGIQLETESNVRQLVKHSLDLYRTKGSERAVDLLFRLVFGVGAEVQYPKDFLFKTSDGVWTNPTYLEVTDRDLTRFEGVQIRGETSGARAFVERVVRKRTKYKTVQALYVTGVRGNFVPGEAVNRSSDPLDTSTCPVIVGSLGSVQVTAGGQGHAVGEEVLVSSSRGVGGRARVTQVQNSVGTVSTTLVSGGWGYTSQTQVLVSNVVITVANVSHSRGTSSEYVDLFDEVSQPLYLVNYDSSTANLARGDVVAVVNSSSQNVASAAVLSVSPSNSSAGIVRLSIYSGSMTSAAGIVHPVSGTANVASKTDQTVTARVLGVGDRIEVYFTGLTGSISAGDVVTRGSATGVVETVALTSSTTGRIVVVQSVGSFLPGALTDVSSGATCSVSSASVPIGVDSESDTFTADDLAQVNASSGLSGRFSSLSTGSGFGVSLSPVRTNQRVVPLALETISPYVAVSLGATSYGFPANPTGNSSSIIASCMSYTNVTMGSISGLIETGSGRDYSVPPVVRIYDPFSSLFNRRGFVLGYEDKTAEFQIGETVNQSSTNARGVIVSANSTAMQVRRTSWEDFASTTGTSSKIVGATSGATADVTYVVDGFSLSNQPDFDLMGADAIVGTQSIIATGAIAELEISDSGHGYEQDGVVTFADGQGTAVLSGVGRGAGFYRKPGGFLSSSKKLRDGHYYQEYSYEVTSSIPVDRYGDMLKAVLHAAGTKFFAAFQYQTTVGAPASVATEVSIT